MQSEHLHFFDPDKPLRVDVHHHFHADENIAGFFHQLLGKANAIMATQAQIAAALAAANAKLDDIGTELDKASTDVAALVASVGGSTPEVDAQLAALQTRIDGLSGKAQAIDAEATGGAAPPAGGGDTGSTTGPAA